MPLDPSKYDIWPLDQVNYVERDEFIQKLLTKFPPQEILLEDSIVSIWNGNHPQEVRAKVDPNTVELAYDYIKFRDKNARLPKFSKWATGMFKGDKELAKSLAAAGKLVDASGDVVISGDVVDILRCADTPHFISCFKYEGGRGHYKNLPKMIAEECPGIAIAYVDDENGKMRGRVWVHHAQRLDTGEDVAVVCQQWAGTLNAMQVAKEIQTKLGIPAFHGTGYGRKVENVNAVKVKFVNCFKEPVHHDMYTWLPEYAVTPVV